MENLDSATVLIVSVASIVSLFTLYAVYTAFGPPAKQLSDPFEDPRRLRHSHKKQICFSF